MLRHELLLQFRGLSEIKRTDNHTCATLLVACHDAIVVEKAYLESGVEMESRGSSVFALAHNLILNQPPAIAFVEGNHPPMFCRFRQPLVARMFSGNPIPLRCTFPKQNANTRFLAANKRGVLSNCILFGVVELHS